MDPQGEEVVVGRIMAPLKKDVCFLISRISEFIAFQGRREVRL